MVLLTINFSINFIKAKQTETTKQLNVNFWVVYDEIPPLDSYATKKPKDKPFLDLSKAFDTINRSQILDILKTIIKEDEQKLTQK